MGWKKVGDITDSYRIYCNGGRVRMCILSGCVQDTIKEWLKHEWNSSSCQRRITPRPLNISGCSFEFRAKFPDAIRKRDTAEKENEEERRWIKEEEERHFHS